MVAAAELDIDTSASAMDMAEAMFGSGITIETASYSGAGRASGTYSGGDETAPGLTPADSGVILSTGRAKDVTNSSGEANVRANTTGRNRTEGDDDLSEISGQATFDAAIFEAEFVPDGDTLTMQVTFSSEEYLEYVDSGFNDAVGVWVNGQQAELTVGDGDISIDNINPDSNANLYIDNPADDSSVNTEMDGLTVTLTLKAPVIPGETNTIKIGIADGGDNKYDSNLLIAGDSIQTALIAGDDEADISATGSTNIDVLGNDSSTVSETLTITAINGTPVVAGDTITLPTGEMVTLNADGTFNLVSDGDLETNTFSYEVTDGEGNTDTAFVKVTTVPCFVAGSSVDTPDGPVAVETLMPGDMVITRDHGAQPVRWTGQAVRAAFGRDAPIAFAAGAMGEEHPALELSPNHRVMVTSGMAELLFGEREVLVKARDLVNGLTIRPRHDRAPVRYVHILFDRHEIIRCNGVYSESYHPGRETLDGFDSATRDEILRLMPSDDALTGYGYGPTARTVLRNHECRALFARDGDNVAWPKARDGSVAEKLVDPGLRPRPFVHALDDHSAIETDVIL